MCFECHTSRLVNWALSIFGWNMQVIKRCQQPSSRHCQALNCGKALLSG